MTWTAVFYFVLAWTRSKLFYSRRR